MPEPTDNSAELSRRRFLKFTGLGLAAGFAAMLVGNRLSAKKRSPRVISGSEDSMFRPRDAGQPRA